MIVGFDVTWMNEQNTSGGMFQYAERLIRALIEHTEIDVVAITGPNGHAIFDDLEGHKNFRRRFLDDPHMFSELLDSEKIHVVHTPKQFLHNVSLAVPMIVTLHDLQHFHHPEFFTEKELRFRDSFYRKSAEFSERVIVSFQHVKEDVVKFYDISPEKIDICPVGMNLPKWSGKENFGGIRNKYTLPETYIYYAANTWPHKNHERLVKAVRLLHDRYGLKVHLVCTGHIVERYFPELQKTVSALKVGEFVHFAGYVPEDDMHLILRNAALAVIPTLYEAGSFPLLEAMANDVPVICSNVTSLPETIGDERFIFDPLNVDQMAERVQAVLTDKKLAEENRENSRRRVKEMSWEAVAHKFVETYSKATESFKTKKGTSYYSKWISNFEVINAHNFGEAFRRKNKERGTRNAELEAIPNSLIWKLTKPLRLAGDLLRRTRKGR